MNKFRNEMEISLGETKILLRPTFENIAAMETVIGSVAYLTWKFSRGARLKDNKDSTVKTAVVTAVQVQSMPSMTECAQIIYWNQAARKPEDETQRLYSLEEIWEMIMQQGGNISVRVLEYLGKIMAGDKALEKDEVTEIKNA